MHMSANSRSWIYFVICLAMSHVRLEASTNLQRMDVKSTFFCNNKGVFRYINGKEMVVLTSRHFKFPVSFFSS